MRAVWSFWTKPFREHHKQVWLTEKHHLLAWVLSVETARRHYPDTALVTDDEGARLLVDQLGLAFNHVSTELNALRSDDPQWWVLGKLSAYRGQLVPFVHIDNDVFLWKRLPVSLETSAVLAQNPETFPWAPDCWYRPGVYDEAIRNASGWAPQEWAWYVASRGSSAICCGILGGACPEFLAYYADLAIRMIRHPRNHHVWPALGNIVGDNILFEQYLLAACLAYHQRGASPQFPNITARFLFSSTEEAFQERSAARVGYTHLIGGAKRNPVLARRLERRVRRDYPQHYARCMRALGN